MQAATANADHDLCVAFITHARTCTDQYIPALVDARAAADMPAGIKAEVAKDRDGVIAQAKQEWATDSHRREHRADVQLAEARAGRDGRQAPEGDDVQREHRLRRVHRLRGADLRGELGALSREVARVDLACYA